MGFFFGDDNSKHVQVMDSNKIIIAMLITLLVIKIIEIIVFFTRGFKKSVTRLKRENV
ncbi:unnamed protein product [Chironomus riparius]|uniref:Uncharacterized protein n=1 Tax=Chironomus riparius TaxID=315576 RepID=A0A9N9RUD8_9DIPT|nr:unnamed protein product [Chironomus riparius]